MKKCPFCAEEIQDAAIVCRYCGRDLEKPAPEEKPATAEDPAAAQPPPADAAEWYYGAEGKPTGPYRWEDLVGMARAGALGRETQIYRKSSGEWRPLSGIPDLVSVLPAKKGAPPREPLKLASGNRAKAGWSLIALGLLCCLWSLQGVLLGWVLLLVGGLLAVRGGGVFVGVLVLSLGVSCPALIYQGNRETTRKEQAAAAAAAEKAAAAEAARQERLEGLRSKKPENYQKGLELLEAGDFQGAVGSLDLVVEVDPEYEDVVAKRQEAVLNRDYSTALSKIEAKDYGGAVTLLQQVVSVDSGFKDAARRLRSATVAAERAAARAAKEAEMAAAARVKAAMEEQRRSATLLVLDWNWSKNYDYVTAEGRVKNQSSRPLSRVIAQVTFFTTSNEMITAEWSFIDLQPILPGQVSTFKVMGRYNPAMKTARLEFRSFGGGTIDSASAK